MLRRIKCSFILVKYFSLSQRYVAKYTYVNNIIYMYNNDFLFEF